MYSDPTILNLWWFYFDLTYSIHIWFSSNFNTRKVTFPDRIYMDRPEYLMQIHKRIIFLERGPRPIVSLLLLDPRCAWYPHDSVHDVFRIEECNDVDFSDEKGDNLQVGRLENWWDLPRCESYVGFRPTFLPVSNLDESATHLDRRHLV